MEDKYLWSALRYVGRNPVRAGLAASPADWEWSGARARLGLTATFGCLDRDFWQEAGGAPRWQSLFAEPEPEEWLNRFRLVTYAGNPFGSDGFIEPLAIPGTPSRLSSPQPLGFVSPASPAHDLSGKGAL